MSKTMNGVQRPGLRVAAASGFAAPLFPDRPTQLLKATNAGDTWTVVGKSH